jgi:hypothetical protein
VSIRAVIWALRGTTVTGSDLVVLIVLALHTRHEPRDDRAWPSVETIAELAHLHPRNVQRCLRRLEAHGLIVAERRGVGRENPTVYRLPLPAGNGVADDALFSLGKGGAEDVKGGADATLSPNGKGGAEGIKGGAGGSKRRRTRHPKEYEREERGVEDRFSEYDRGIIDCEESS